MSHMINAGQIRQVGEQEIILNAVDGVQRFGVQEGLQEVIPHQQDVNDQQPEQDPDDAWSSQLDFIFPYYFDYNALIWYIRFRFALHFAYFVLELDFSLAIHLSLCL